MAPDPEFTWVDYSSQLHIGNITTGAQQVVRRADANPTTPLVVEGDWIWWARTGPLVDGQPQQVPPGGVPRSYTGLVGFDRTTGRTVTIPKATQVFASLDRRFLYAAFYAPGAYSGYWTGVRRPTNWLTIGEYAPDGRSLHRSYPWPKGWSVATGDLLGDPSPATASGILVRSVPAQIGVSPQRLGIWNLTTDRVRALGWVWQVDGTFTAPHARSSLVAWLPRSCVTQHTQASALRITNTATLRTVYARNPLGYGFNWGGAFSPDGRTLAAFLSIPGGRDGPETQLCLINVGTGAVTVVPGARINNGEAVSWAQWLPDGRHLVAGGVGRNGTANGITPANRYLVDAATLAITPFRFLSDGNADMNLSAVLLNGDRS